MRVAPLVACSLLLGCGDDRSGAGPGDDAGPDDPSAAIYAPDRLLAIEIEMSASDWDVLRVQHQDLFARFTDDCPGPAAADSNTVFPATVTVDGERVEQVGKKGFLGSRRAPAPRSSGARIGVAVAGVVAAGRAARACPSCSSSPLRRAEREGRPGTPPRWPSPPARPPRSRSRSSEHGGA